MLRMEGTAPGKSWDAVLGRPLFSLSSESWSCALWQPSVPIVMRLILHAAYTDLLRGISVRVPGQQELRQFPSLQVFRTEIISRRPEQVCDLASHVCCTDHCCGHHGSRCCSNPSQGELPVATANSIPRPLPSSFRVDEAAEMRHL